MQPFAERLSTDNVLIGDGAHGTMLLQEVLEVGQCPESAVLSHANAVQDIARRYVDAGAEYIETNTFGATPLKLALSGLEIETETINHTAVQLARSAAAGTAYVVASCGPTGRMLEPWGDTPREAVYDSYRKQMESLSAAGVDAVFIETMTDLEEAKLAISATRDVMPSVPVVAMMTFDRTPRGFFTIMGVSVEAAVSELTAAGVQGIGSNCGTGIDQMIDLAKEFRRHATLPLIFQPNAGLPESREGRIYYDETPASMAAKIPALIEAGASIVGGCCGTTPGHIRAIRQAARAA
ncbi:MAG: homocysteine S-methyltransferase family protein [Gemmatimonadales bacterium]